MSILDSGSRREFSTGAVRDIDTEKGRCDLIPLKVLSRLLQNGTIYDPVIQYIAEFQETGRTYFLYRALHSFIDDAYKGDKETAFLEVAKHFAEGCEKYGENNWQKGLPVGCYIDSAVRHYLKYKRGDNDEPHDRALIWNVMCCIWEVDYHAKAE